jgi:2-polyprenyl-6-methoxyphenol hydroxylase-like FAD-dependent oxidoreductase
MNNVVQTRCCIAGGGPAGMMSALLLNLAIQDAVATANLLGEKLLHGTPSEEELQIVQRRRRFPTWATQQIQITIQNRAIGRVLGRPRSLTLPWQLKLLRRWPILRRIPARLVGIGVRPEHVKTPEVTTIRETTVA